MSSDHILGNQRNFEPTSSMHLKLPLTASCLLLLMLSACRASSSTPTATRLGKTPSTLQSTWQKAASTRNFTKSDAGGEMFLNVENAD